MSPVRVRFAPSPTGFLHVGGARTALFNWLFARKHRGTFILRVEDTDQSRNTEEAVQVIYDGLNWLGLDWNEGPLVGGDLGPYFQSQRNAIYERYLKQLQDGGHIYDDAGALRFRSPRQTVGLEDAVCGRIEFDMSNPGTHPDMTIRRPDGSWIFHFVNVVDDIEMKISHVIRGEDHLSNTPKHIELYQSLGVAPPIFAHIPLILKKDGKGKMSKRDEGSSVNSYIDGGYVPEALRNYLCLLGWSPKDNREKLDIDEVVQLFDLDKINRRAASFDLDKCFWLNGQYIAQMPMARFRELCVPQLQAALIPFDERGEAYLEHVLELVKEKIKLLTEVVPWTRSLFVDDFPYEESAVEKTLKPAGTAARLRELAGKLNQVTDWTHDPIEAAFKELATAAGVKPALFIHPARIAVSGRAVGPGLYQMIVLLGKDRVLARLEKGAALAG